MRKFLKFVHDDNVYCKYYEVFYILFHTPFKFAVFAREGAAPLPGIKGDGYNGKGRKGTDKAGFQT